MPNLPSHARVVVIGGGAVGCSILYHLAEAGWRDLLLLEKNELTAGSTWHAAGNCPNFSSNWGVMRLQHYSTQLYKTLGERTGYPMNYHVTGSVRLAQTRERFEEFHHVANLGRYYGINFNVCSPAELKARYEFLETHDLEGGLWDPDDGDIDPAQLTQAYATGARAKGATIIRNCPVTGLEQLPSGEWLVRTADAAVKADLIVNAAGYYAPNIAAMMGRDLPSVVLEHQYMITADIPELASLAHKLPLLRDPDDSYYLRQERHGLLLGPYEHRLAKSRWTDDSMPEDFSFQLFPDDLDRLESYIEKACARVPLLGTAGISKVINGPIPYAPDGLPLLGPVPGKKNAFEACAFTFGIVQSGGAGKVMADIIVEGEPEWDVWSLDPRRYTGFVTKTYCEAKAIETYQDEYGISFQRDEKPAGRPAKMSPVHKRLADDGAVFGARNGWERAVWFAKSGDSRDEKSNYHPTAWFDRVGEECRAVMSGCGILDLPGFTRFEVTGTDAAAFLDRLIAGKLPKPGRTSLAYVLSPKGGTQSEFTITTFAPGRFWLISAAVAEWHDRDLLEQSVLAGEDVTIRNVTEQFGTLILAGPKSRELLQSLSRSPLDNAAFPWLSVRNLSISETDLIAFRISYVGELGYELHVPVESMLAVHDAIIAAGKPFGLTRFGMYAMDSMRLEKGYLAWKSDITTEFTAREAGLDRFISADKLHSRGQEAMLRRDNGPNRHRLVTMTTDARTEAPYGSLILHGERIAGFVSSSAFGHRTRTSILLGYVRAEELADTSGLSVNILGKRHPVEVAREALYDPDNSRLRA
jgi:dimethylglycine dehydrogenase